MQRQHKNMVRLTKNIEEEEMNIYKAFVLDETTSYPLLKPVMQQQTVQLYTLLYRCTVAHHMHFSSVLTVDLLTGAE